MKKVSVKVKSRRLYFMKFGYAELQLVLAKTELVAGMADLSFEKRF